MATVEAAPTLIRTLADLQERLGGIPLERIRFRPYPGTATVQDVLDAERLEHKLCELVEGVLVEKAMGYEESLIAVEIIRFLANFVAERKLGYVTGEGGMVKLAKRLVRIPDVAFVSTGRLPGGKPPRRPIPKLAPNLAVEVLSKSNTKREMKRKRREYFAAGTRLVWEVIPNTRTVDVYTAPATFRRLDESESVDGGDVLPGFKLSIRKWFERAARGSGV